MSVSADDVRQLILSDLDDQGIVFPDALFLRQLSRCQGWIALRYHLLRETVPVLSVPNAPFYAMPVIAPRMVVVTHMQRGDGTVLWPVPFAHLRYANPAWIGTTGTPLYFARLGWRYVVLYPVPSVAEILQMSGTVLPAPVGALTDLLQVPDVYVPQVVLLTAGMLVVSQERRIPEGLERIRAALGIPSPQAQPVSVVPTEVEEVRT